MVGLIQPKLLNRLSGLIKGMAKAKTHAIVIDEIDYEWLTKFVGYGETIADALKKVRRIVESEDEEESR